MTDVLTKDEYLKYLNNFDYTNDDDYYIVFRSKYFNKSDLLMLIEKCPSYRANELARKIFYLVNNEMLSVEILSAISKKTYNTDQIKKILSFNNINGDTLLYIFNNLMRYNKIVVVDEDEYVEIIRDIIKHPSFNELVLNKMCLELPEEFLNYSEIFDLLINSTYLTPYSFAALYKPELDEKIVEKYFNHPLMTTTILENIINQIDFNNLDSTAIHHLEKLAPVDVATEEILMTLVDLVQDLTFKKSFNNDISIILKLYKTIFSNKNCTEKIVLQVLYSISDAEFALELPGLSDKLKRRKKVSLASIITAININSMYTKRLTDIIFNKNSLKIDDVKFCLERLSANREIDPKIDISYFLDKTVDYMIKNYDKFLYDSFINCVLNEISTLESNIDDAKKMKKANKKILNNYKIIKENLIKVMDRFFGMELPKMTILQLIDTAFNPEYIRGITGAPNLDMDIYNAIIRRANNLKEINKIVFKTGKADSDFDIDYDLFYLIAEQVKNKVLGLSFTIEEEENVTEMLRLNVEDGLSTMLWGPSGVGKTSRVFEVDPTATMLILKNGMLPEEVIGGRNPASENAEDEPPHWYKELVKKCTDEPNRNHILFIDEFTNVTDSYKNLVWEIVGSRCVRGRSDWVLPENASIVLAGNRPDESTAVRLDASGGVMPEPLHNRIDSMIEIEFDINEWQKWALETNPETGMLKIHPIVYSFCVSHADEVMFTKYDSSDVTKPFLTPRKWETLSKAIYKAYERGEKNHISDARAASIIGKGAIFDAFKTHYERPPLDMKKVEDGLYTEEDFPKLEDKTYALGMIIASDIDSAIKEDFVATCLGEEYLSIYETMTSVRENTLKGSSEIK